MRSEFRIDHTLFQSAIVLTAIVFVPLPFLGLLFPDPLMPVFIQFTISLAVCIPVIYLCFKNIQIVTIKLEEHQLRIFTPLTQKELIYGYTDIVKVFKEVRKIDTTINYRSAYRRAPTFVYKKYTTIYFNDGFQLELDHEVYANVENMVSFIDTKMNHRTAFH